MNSRASINKQLNESEFQYQEYRTGLIIKAYICGRHFEALVARTLGCIR